MSLKATLAGGTVTVLKVLAICLTAMILPLIVTENATVSLLLYLPAVYIAGRWSRRTLGIQ